MIKGCFSSAFSFPVCFILLSMSSVLSRFSVTSISPSGHASLPIVTEICAECHTTQSALSNASSAWSGKRGGNSRNAGTPNRNTGVAKPLNILPPWPWRAWRYTKILTGVNTVTNSSRTQGEPRCSYSVMKTFVPGQRTGQRWAASACPHLCIMLFNYATPDMR